MSMRDYIFFEFFELYFLQYTFYQKDDYFIILAKRRDSPGYARNHGFSSSGKFWEICFV